MLLSLGIGRLKNDLISKEFLFLCFAGVLNTFGNYLVDVRAKQTEFR